jgi:hypothetical protein
VGSAVQYGLRNGIEYTVPGIPGIPRESPTRKVTFYVKYSDGTMMKGEVALADV